MVLFHSITSNQLSASTYRSGRHHRWSTMLAGVSAAVTSTCPSDKVEGRRTSAGRPGRQGGQRHGARGHRSRKRAARSIKERQLRFRRLTIEPGGIVPWHSHGDRPRSSTSRKARSSNMPATARLRLYTRPVRSGRRLAALRIGGRTSATKPSFCCWRRAARQERPQHVTVASAPVELRVTSEKPETLQGVTSLPLINGGSREDHDMAHCSILGSGADGDARSPFRGAVAHGRNRLDCLSDGRRSVCDAGDPSVAGARLQRHAGGHGLCRQFQHHGHGGCRPACRFVQSADRPATGHPDQPCGPVNPDGAPFRLRPI